MEHGTAGSVNTDDGAFANEDLEPLTNQEISVLNQILSKYEEGYFK